MNEITLDQHWPSGHFQADWQWSLLSTQPALGEGLEVKMVAENP